jgi:hypothetical protein
VPNTFAEPSELEEDDSLGESAESIGLLLDGWENSIDSECCMRLLMGSGRSHDAQDSAGKRAKSAFRVAPNNS